VRFIVHLLLGWLRKALLYNITVIILNAVIRITKNNLVYTVVKG